MKNNSKNKIITNFTAILLAISSIICICLCSCKQNSNQNTEPTDSTVATDTTVKTTGDKIHIIDNTLGEIWLTELAGVSVNKLDNNNFTSDETFKYYSENGKPCSEEGIDVSAFCGDIDWEKVKNSGVDFAIIRLGGRGYGSDGKLYKDERAIEYLNGAKKAGLKIGGYFYSQAITNEEAIEEADYAKSVLGDIKLDYPLVYDWEIVKDDDARTDNITPAQATACAKAFCARVKELGYKPMIYSPGRELYFKYDLSQLADIDIWYCEYSDLPNFYYQFSMWQYSSTGKIDGINSDVDLNICFTNIVKY